jgi:hypothetical protein
VGPQFRDRAGDVAAVLTGMTTDPDAAEILRELSFPHGIEPVATADLDALSSLVPPAGG